MNVDFSILLNSSIPFDNSKIEVLDLLMELFYTKPFSLNVVNLYLISYLVDESSKSDFCLFERKP